MEPSKFPDSWSATTLVTPGMWHELSQIFLLLAHCQICNAMSLQSFDLMPPIALRYDTVVVLSDWILMCLSVKSLHKDCKPNKTAFISK